MSGGSGGVAVGQLFGADERYMPLRLVAAGAVGSVWVANDARSGGEVAVKILSDSAAHDPALLARFEREAHLAAQLSHPNVVRVLEHHVGPAGTYLVMENVAGGTLAERLSAGPLDRWDLQELAQDLLGTLVYLHGAGVLHRDLEPANVLLGTDGRLRLTAFGLAPRAGEESPGGDLYACGLLLGQCVGPDTPAPLLEVIDRLSAPDPARRPATAAAALALLGVEAPVAPVPPVPVPVPVPLAQPTAPMSVEETPAPTLADFAVTGAFEPAADLAMAQVPAAQVPAAQLPEAQVPVEDFPPVEFAVPQYMPSPEPTAISDFPPTAVQPPWSASASPPAYPPAPEDVYRAEYDAAYEAAYASYVPRRRRPVKRFVLAAAVIPIALAIAAFGMAASKDEAEKPLPPPAQGTLSQQLDGLDQAIDLARN